MPEYAAIDGRQVELTEWFPAEIDPLREGAYETLSLGISGLWRWWDGARWHHYSHSAEAAFHMHSLGCPKNLDDGEEWRGLAHPPGAT